jgi:hypothetical protein
MTTSPRLGLPYLQGNQAQKHVTLNEALGRLDALVQLAVISAVVSDQPETPLEGDLYLVPETATGEDWAGAVAGDIAVFLDGAWLFVTPQPGWTVFDRAAGVLRVCSEAGWQPLPVLLAGMGGINAEPDSVNRFAVKSDAELLSHDDVTPGSGDARKVINKAGAGNTASIVFQNGFSGRAEIGLAGDDRLRFKVSADGTDWKEALVADEDSGAVSFPEGVVHAATGAAVSQLALVAGGDGITSIYRIDTARAQNPRTAIVDSTSGDLITLTTTTAGLFFDTSRMTGVCYVRIWNTTKTPPAPAWVKARPAATRLQVLDASAISGWATGETIQIGDPADVTPNRFIALDISPMLQTVFGGVFPQRGVMLKAAASGVGEAASVVVAPSGTTGAGTPVQSLADGGIRTVQMTVPTTIPSPISDSNLLFVQETAAGSAMAIANLLVIGVWV